jgi:hypothetical protein
MEASRDISEDVLVGSEVSVSFCDNSLTLKENGFISLGYSALHFHHETKQIPVASPPLLASLSF